MLVGEFFDMVLQGKVKGSIKQAYYIFCKENNKKHSPKSFYSNICKARKRKQLKDL